MFFLCNNKQMPNQSIRECDRCVAIAKSGSRCRNRTCKGRKCWIHTKRDEGLRIKPSQIPNAGQGLYATKRFAKGDRIADYTAEKLTRAQVDNRYPGNVTAEYVLCRSDRECFDGRRTNSSFARFSNDARGSAQFNNNARFTPGAHNRQPIMRAGRVITAGVEIFTNYGGGGYWNNNAQ